MDISKAYDRVEWYFLEATIIQLGFDLKCVQWTMKCVTLASYGIG